MMKHDQSEALDKSLALLEAGSTLEECLALYPEHSTDLRPLLEIALQVHHVPAPTSSPAAFAAGKQRMLQALAEKERQKVSVDPFSGGVEWIAALFKRVPLQIRVPALLTFATTALFLLVCAGALLLSWIGGTATQAATLAQVTGLVEIMPAGSDTWRPASVGGLVREGDRVHTHPLSAATLVFFNKSTTDLAADTEIAVTQMSSQRGGDPVVVLYQSLGQTYNQVQRLPDNASRFEIETPTAVVAVHGTEFVLTVEADGTTYVAVVEGVVNVTAQGTTVAVRAGQETTVQAKQSPTPTHSMPTATPTPRFTPTPQATETPAAVETPKPTETPASPEVPEPGETPESPSSNTPQPPEPTKTHQPPGLTKTPEPPGQTRQPPAPTQKPKPTKKPK